MHVAPINSQFTQVSRPKHQQAKETETLGPKSFILLLQLYIKTYLTPRTIVVERLHGLHFSRQRGKKV